MTRPNSASNSAASGAAMPSSRKRASASSANSSTRPSRKACDKGKDFDIGPSCPLVMIEWEDSAQPIASWSYLSSFEPTGIVRCASVGWLIRDGTDFKALAPNMGAINDERSLQVSGVIQIPTGCVLRVTQLSEPEPLSDCPSSRPAKGPKRQGA